ncbi:hypothetical protein PSAC2689_20347 [Paraburkholderia sacchari]
MLMTKTDIHIGKLGGMVINSPYISNDLKISLICQWVIYEPSPVPLRARGRAPEFQSHGGGQGPVYKPAGRLEGHHRAGG